MNETLITIHQTKKRLSMYSLIFVLLLGLSGYYLAFSDPIQSISDLSSLLLVYFLIPTVVVLFGYLLGWYTKKHAVEYNPPEWEFKTTILSLDESREILRMYPKTYFYAVAFGQLWQFLIPPLLILANIFIAIYSVEINGSLQPFVPILYSLFLASSFFLAVVGAYLATSNIASHDFALPHFREPLWLAEIQATVPGISLVKIAVETARHNEFVIYKEPRAAAYLQAIEEKSLIESWSEELGAITRLVGRLATENGKKFWSWNSQERAFWCYETTSNVSQYVSPPIQTRERELGVKDVRLITANAVAIILLEWLNQHPDNEEVKDILRKLGVPPLSTTSSDGKADASFVSSK